jgi:tRNA-dihydrouridine synthase A
VIFGDSGLAPDCHRVLDAYIPYVQEGLDRGVPLNAMTRHILGLFHGRPGARSWRRHLSENAHRPGAGIEVLRAAGAMARCHRAAANAQPAA